MWRELIDLGVPRRCVGCGLRETSLCPGCRAALSRLGRGESRPTRPDPCPPGMPRVWSLTTYDDVVREVIVGHKDHGQVSLRPVLARLWRTALAGVIIGDAALADAVRVGSAVVVPVPSATASIRRRGRDPWREVVTEALSPELVPVHAGLRLRRRVRDQAGLDAVARAANLRGAMCARRALDLSGMTCVIADDVVTTGATLVESARALRAAGANDVLAVVVAATARRSLS